MDQLQRELEGEGLPVQIIGVNDVGLEAGNEAMCMDRDLPWLQNTMEVDAWNLWGVEYRDVVVVDGEGYRQHTFNVTEHDLSEPANYEGLRRVLRELASD